MDQVRQTRNNFLTNVLSLVVNTAVGLFYTPYLVRSLGIAAYGIVPLALIINQYIGVITGSLTGSLTRFYSVALQQKNYADASKYLSSSFAAIIALAIGLAPLLVLVVMKLGSIFNIPIEYLSAAKILFLFTLLSFMLSLFSSLLNVALYALNRLDLMNLVKTIRAGFKVVFTVVFFEAITKDVAYIGAANFLTEAADFLISYYFYNKTTEQRVRIAPRFFEKTALVSMLSMTVWVIIHQIGDTGLYRIDTVMVNLFWSTKESGILGALSEFGGYVMTIVSVIGSLFGPLILIAYAREDHKAVIKLAMDNSLVVGTASALFVGFLIGFSKPIIGLWLGAEYTEYSTWFILKQLTVPFYAAAGVYSFVFKAWNRVMFPALFTLTVGVVNFAVSYTLCSISGGSQEYILMMLAIAALSILIQSYGLNAYTFRRLYPDLPIGDLVLVFFKIAFILVMTGAVTYTAASMIDAGDVLQLGAAMAASVAVSAVIAFYTVFDRPHRLELMQYFRIAELTSH